MMWCNILYVCTLTIIALWGLISSADIHFTKYIDYGLVEYKCLPNESSFEVGNISNALECGKLCQMSSVCVSFCYRPDLYTCIGCREKFEIFASSYEPYPNFRYFSSKKLISENSCKDIKEKYTSPPSGVYKILLWKSKKISLVYCDMDTDGGGWTVFQNRFDGSVDFYRNFSEYENGFGAVNGEFWLGLKTVQEMTAQGSTEIRFDATSFTNKTVTEIYSGFYLDKGPYYILHFDWTSPGTSATRMAYNNGQKFSTYDFDQEVFNARHCALDTMSAWWHSACSNLYVNGQYGGGNNTGMNYVTVEGPANNKVYWFLKTSKLMFR